MIDYTAAEKNMAVAAPVCNEKKNARRRRKHCALAVVRWSQKFLPHRRPLSRGSGMANI